MKTDPLQLQKNRIDRFVDARTKELLLLFHRKCPDELYTYEQVSSLIIQDLIDHLEGSKLA